MQDPHSPDKQRPAPNAPTVLPKGVKIIDNAASAIARVRLWDDDMATHFKDGVSCRL